MVKYSIKIMKLCNIYIIIKMINIFYYKSIDDKYKNYI